MKYSIQGFYQPRAIELGLTNDDLLVLRWLVDFAGTDQMKTITEPDGIYYWINYATILEDLPILKISKDWLKRRIFNNLCEAKVLKHKHIKQGGRFSYYAFDINYKTLVAEINTQGYGENDGTHTENNPYPYGENDGTKINLLNNKSNNNTNNSKPSKSSLVKEVIDYMNTCGKKENFKIQKTFNFKANANSNVKIITARLNEGYTLDDLKDVIYHAYRKLIENEFKGYNGKSSIQYYNPTTIFTSEKVEKYLNEYNNL